MTQYTAIIKDVTPHPLYKGRLICKIYSDSKGRFDDGTVIYTSKVLSKTSVPEGTLYKTLNSTYLEQHDSNKPK